MNRFTKSLLAVALFTGGGITTFAQTDVTSQYLKNADFEGTYSESAKPMSDRTIFQPEGWTVNYTNGENYDMTALKDGDAQYNNFSSLAQPTNGGKQTYWTRFRWGTNESLSLTQTIANLPAGTYTLSADVFLTSSAASVSLKAGNETAAIKPSETEKTKGKWEKVNLTFTLTQSNSNIDIVYNVSQTKQEETVAGIDNITLAVAPLALDVVKKELSQEITSAKAIWVGDDNADLTTAISTAQAAYDAADATAESVSEATNALKEAEANAIKGSTVADGDYYLYDPAKRVFLSRGASYGTEAAADKYGVPFTWNSSTGVIGFKDITIGKDDAGRGLRYEATGTSLYTDNASPSKFVFVKTGDSYYLMKDGMTYGASYNLNGGYGPYAYLTATQSEGTKWLLKTKAEHDAIVSKYADENKSAVAKSAGVESFDGYVSNLVKTVNASTYTWSGTNRKENNQPTAGDANTPREAYSCTGTFSQTISDLTPGIYRVTINAFERDGSNENCVALAKDNYFISTAYLSANDQQVQLKSWAEDRAGDADPNSISDAKKLFNNNKYLSEVYTYVGEDGKLNLKVAVPTWWGAHWVIMGDTKIYSLQDAVSEEQSNTLISTAGTLSSEKMLATTKTTLDEAKAALSADKTNKTKYQALSDAVAAAQSSVDAYAIAKTTIDARAELLKVTNFYKNDDSFYNNVLAAYNNGTLAETDAKNLENPYATAKIGWHASTQLNQFFGGAWGFSNYDTGLYINTWSVEGDTDGSNFKVPFYEYFANNDTPLSARTLTGTLTGLTPGWYKVSLDAREQLVNAQNAAVKGISMNVNDGASVELNKGVKTADKNNLFYANYTAYGQVGDDGVLKLNIVVADGTNVHWLAFQHVNYEAVTPEQATIGAAKFATYVTKSAVDFSTVENLKAYTAKVANKTITLTEASTVSAGTAVVLYGEAGTYTLTPSAIAETVDNDLKASDGNVKGDGTIWALTTMGAAAGFAPVAENVAVPAGKAYLQISADATAGAKFLGFTGDVVTGINAVEANDAASDNAPAYNLAGQRVGKSYKGVVIKNGKKLLQK